MRASALRIGNIINQTELGRDVGIAQPQVHRFLDLMETSYQAVRLSPYAVNRTRRLKAPSSIGVIRIGPSFLGKVNRGGRQWER